MECPFYSSGVKPIINTYSVDFKNTPEEIEWFYPISESLAVLISESEREKISSVSEEEVKKYNEMMFKLSYKQIYAADHSDLESFQKV